MKLSDKMELIVYILEECKADVRWFTKQQEEAEADETNLNHELEGVGNENNTPPNYEQRAKIATQLQNALIKRRVAKDAIRVNQPLIRFLESDVGTKSLSQLKQILGELRKVESNMANRVYGKRGQYKEARNPDMDKKLDRMIKQWKKVSKRKH